MGELIVLAVIVILLAGCGRTCVWGWRRLQEGSNASKEIPGSRGRTGELSDRRRDPDVAVTTGGGDASSAEDRLERLKRRFVEGQISMEEYERRLDELDFRDEL